MESGGRRKMVEERIMRSEEWGEEGGRGRRV